MKKLLLFICSTLPLFSLEIDVAVGSYYAKAKGTVEYQTDFFAGSQARIDNQAQNHFYISTSIDAKMHYIPLFKFEYTRIRSIGVSSVNIGTSNVVVNEIVQAVGVQGKQFNSTLTYNIYDALLYYQFFKDSKYAMLTAGAGLKSVDYNYDVDILEAVIFNDKGGSNIPMIYFGARRSVYENISVDFDSKYYIFGDSDIYDIRLKMDILYPLNSQINAGFELGYRDFYSNIKGDDVENIGGDMHYQGVFFGVTANFK